MDKTDQGTGKHPHKSSRDSKKQSSSRSAQSGEKMNAGPQQSGSSDLKEREYRDAQGNIHHHTRTYEEQHKGNK